LATGVAGTSEGEMIRGARAERDCAPRWTDDLRAMSRERTKAITTSKLVREEWWPFRRDVVLYGTICSPPTIHQGKSPFRIDQSSFRFNHEILAMIRRLRRLPDFPKRACPEKCASSAKSADTFGVGFCSRIAEFETPPGGRGHGGHSISRDGQVRRDRGSPASWTAPGRSAPGPWGSGSP
jgi:hypothetical protein